MWQFLSPALFLWNNNYITIHERGAYAHSHSHARIRFMDKHRCTPLYARIQFLEFFFSFFRNSLLLVFDGNNMVDGWIWIQYTALNYYYYACMLCGVVKIIINNMLAARPQNVEMNVYVCAWLLTIGSLYIDARTDFNKTVHLGCGCCCLVISQILLQITISIQFLLFEMLIRM